MISIIAFIFPAITTIIGFYILFVGLIYDQDNYWALGIGAAIACYGIYHFKDRFHSRFNDIEALKLVTEKTFDWYVSANPECYVDSKLSCSHCDSKAIVITPDHRTHYKALFSPYTPQKYNRHYCKHCTSVLFYSPIQAETLV